MSPNPTETGGAVGDDAFESEDLEDVPVQTGESSLPHPDEVRGLGGSDEKNKKRKWLCPLLASLVFVSFVVGLSLGLTLNRPRPPSSSSSAESYSGKKPDGTVDHAGRGTAVGSFLVERGISTSGSLSNVDSAQHRAAVWMASEDPALHPVPPPSGGDSTSADKFAQRYVLAVLYYSLGGEGWMDGLNFMTEVDECSWSETFRTTRGKMVALGAACGGDGRLDRIWTPWNNGLAGTLPDEIGRLPYLRSVSMQYGNITGTIPESITDLKSLEEMGLSNNIMTGLVPSSLKDVKNLKILALDDNAFTGRVADTLSEMEKLEFVYLEDNMFTGDIAQLRPDKLPELIHLDLSTNSFTGKISPSLLNHPKLEVIDMHLNDLSGEIPDGIESQTTLDFLALHMNNLEGQIPLDVHNLQGLSYLDLSHNKLTGQIPHSMNELGGLEYLFLGGNFYDPGEIPLFIQSLKEMRELSLKSCNRTGPIPEWIGDLSDMYLLDLDGNDLTGPIPESVGDLGDLFILMLNRNRLNGTVPRSLTKNKNLEMLLLDGNDITGDIGFLCDDRDDKIEWIAADCGDAGGARSEVVCPETCCRVCCADGNTDCDDDDWLINNDPIWEHSYARTRFVFQQ